jgi:SpoVK/Ycf46/Vps4 family AAA+-type ATPase
MPKLSWTGNRLLVAFITFTIYAVAWTVVTHYAGEWLKERGEGHAVGSEHKAAVRACVFKPEEAKHLEDVGGLLSVKEDLRRRVVIPMKYPELFFRGPRALRPARGILLHGPPGTGKTMLARALASECGASFVSLSAATLENKWWGESAKLIQAAFLVAREELQPCILFFDEIDGMGRTRSSHDQACTYSFKVELLRNMDGVEGADSAAAVIVLACTNCIESLDPALRRRLPHVIHVGVPDAAARYDILQKLVLSEASSPPTSADDGSAKHSVATLPRSCARVLRKVSRMTEGMTGADLNALYSTASSARLNELDIPSMIEEFERRGAKSTASSHASQVLSKAGPVRMEHWVAAIGQHHASKGGQQAGGP